MVEKSVYKKSIFTNEGKDTLLFKKKDKLLFF